MKLLKPFLALLCVSISFVIGYLWFQSPKLIEKTIRIENIGDVRIFKSAWDNQATVIIFADSRKYFQGGQLHELAASGLSLALIDAPAFLKAFTSASHQCLDAKALDKVLSVLKDELNIYKDHQLFIAGIGEGALLPYINSQHESKYKIKNLSLGFSIDLPVDLALCSPYITEHKAEKQKLVSSPDLKDNWRSVWTDKPAGANAIYIKEKVPNADTYIAAYNTPLDTLLINEMKSALGQGKDQAPIPIIETPAAKKGDTVTLFYSGDGGWRDLDKSVAEKMAALNYSVLGVDVLRYFWERKTPDQVTADLATTLQYYRKKWGVKSFVLAGFSFGADILPVIYNRLSQADKDNVKLLVFLALGNHADFEVHIAGWLGQSTHEMPLASELEEIPGDKILCIYGKKEKEATGTACSSLEAGKAEIIELPGGHHFDEDYTKLTRLILDVYRQHGITD